MMQREKKDWDKGNDDCNDKEKQEDEEEKEEEEENESKRLLRKLKRHTEKIG